MTFSQFQARLLVLLYVRYPYTANPNWYWRRGDKKTARYIPDTKDKTDEERAEIMRDIEGAMLPGDFD